MTGPHERPLPTTHGGAVGSLAALRAARPQDVWLAHDVLPDRIERTWVDGATVAWTSTHPVREVRWFTAVGDDPDVVASLTHAALAELRAAGVVVSGTTVAAGAHDRLPDDDRAPSPDLWSWWWTREVPASRPGMRRVHPVAADDPRLPALLAHSPSVYVLPGDPRVRAWYAVAEGDDLVACGAHVQHVPGVPHLASVVTRPDRRGRGLAADVCARLTADALDEGAGIVTLGMYVGNAVAQRVYERLGFRCERVFASGYLPGQSPPPDAPEHDVLPADSGGAA